MRKAELSRKIHRRNFLQATLGLTAAGVLYLPALAEAKKPVGQDHFAFLSDIHIRKKPIRKVHTPKRFAEVSEQVLSQPELPAAVIICGDCACLTGKPEDYLQLRESLKPLREGGVPVYLILGNHDDRDELWKAFPEQKAKDTDTFSDPKHMKIVSAPSVHLFLLDSKITKDFRCGKLGKDQLEWLDKKLNEFSDRPVICMAHHPPALDASPLTDYAKMCEVLEKYPQAKGYFFGHAHEWYQTQNEKGKHWEVCLPSPAYQFKKGEPIGWVDAQFNPKGVKLTLHAIDTKHPKHGEVVELAWKD